MRRGVRRSDRGMALTLALPFLPALVDSAVLAWLAKGAG